MNCITSRRNFLLASASLTATGLSIFSSPSLAQEDEGWMIGPTKGYTPEIGTLVSMLNFTRMQVLHNVKGLSQADLDFLIDGKANTIGALLMHLAATETYYGLNTFGGMKWESWPDEVKKKWDIPMNLDEPARKAIKGNSLDYYLNALHESREKNLAEFKKRDDKWLTVVDTEMGMNNYAKWFHVAEHESNHDGQIKFLKGRVPGAKPSGNS
jgi:uncharacterized damage-inducible protein DinB